jgi:hypothetical protein
MTGGGAGSSGGDNVEISGRTEGDSGTESGGRAEELFGLREGGTGGGGGRGTTANTHNGALRPQTHHSCTCQHLAYDIRFIKSVKGKEKGDRRRAVHVSVRHIYSVFVPR